MTMFTAGVVVRAHIDASNAGEALQILCEAIRNGIGPDTDQPRPHDIAIAASHVSGDIRVNEAMLTDMIRSTTEG